MAVLALPGDVLHQPAAHATGHSALTLHRGAVLPSEKQVSPLAKRLNNADAVTLRRAIGKLRAPSRNKFTAAEDTPERRQVSSHGWDLPEFLCDVLKVREFP